MHSHRAKSAKPVKPVKPWHLPRVATVLACLVYVYLLAPGLTVIPLSLSETFSLGDWSLALYRRLFASSDWMRAARNSAGIAALASTLAVLVGVPAAWAFVRGRFWGRSAGQLLVLGPLFVPVIVLALGLYFLGVWSGLLGSFTLLTLAHAVAALPFVVVMGISGLRGVPAALEHAASLMGASSLRVFWRVVLPQMRVSVLAGWLFGFLASFDEVIIAWFVAGPQTETLPVRMYSSIMWDNTPEIAAVSTLLTLISFVICLLVIRAGGVQATAGSGRT